MITIGDTYYFRRRVPVDLLERVGEKYFKRTLNTKDLQEAKIRLRRVASEHDELIKKLRSELMLSSAAAETWLATDGTLMMRYQDPLAPKPYGKSVSQLLPDVLGAKPYSQASIDAMKLAARRFTEICGEIDVTHVSRYHIETFRDVLRRLPKYPPHKVRRMMAPDQADWADMNGTNRIGVKRINDALMWVQHILKYAYDKTSAFQDRAWTNPVSGFVTKVREGEMEERLPFSIEQLEIVFGRDVYGQAATPALFWVPLILLFTGARLNEISQSAAVDVVNSGTPHFDLFSRKNGRTAKTAAGYRKVPIHQDLIDLGLLEYSKVLQDAGENYLFPELPHHRSRHRADKLSDAFITMFRGHGQKHPQSELNTPHLATHSLRHSFETNALGAGVEAEMLDIFVGHTPVGEGRKHYAKTLRQQPDVMKRTVLDKMNFPDVSWMCDLAAATIRNPVLSENR